MLLRWFLTSQSGSESATATAKYILPHKMAEIFKWFKCSYNHPFPLNLAVSILHAIRLAARTRHSWQSGGCLATCLAHVSADAPVALGGHRNHLQCRHQRGSVSILISWGWLWYQGGRYNQSLRAVTTSLPFSFTRIDTVWYISRVHGFQFSRQFIEFNGGKNDDFV